MDEVESFKHHGKTVTIYIDPDPWLSNPREMSNLSHMVCWNRSYNLGDEQRTDSMTADELRAEVSGEAHDAEIVARETSPDGDGDVILAILPLYYHDYACGSMRCGDYLSPEPSRGQDGWAYVTKKSTVKMGCIGVRHDRVDDKIVEVGTWDLAAWEEAIRQEVETYDQFMRGEVYGYEVVGADGDVIDGCWGFLGDVKYCREQACEAAEGDDPADDRKAEELASRATYAGVSA